MKLSFHPSRNLPAIEVALATGESYPDALAKALGTHFLLDRHTTKKLAIALKTGPSVHVLSIAEDRYLRVWRTVTPNEFGAAYVTNPYRIADPKDAVWANA